MPAERQNGPGPWAVEGRRIGRWAASPVKHCAGRQGLTLVSCDLDLALGDHRCGHIQHIVGACRVGRTSSHRIGRKSTVTTAVWGDKYTIPRSVDEMDRDQPRFGQFLGPGTDPPQMGRVADGDQRETVLRGTGYCLFHRAKPDHLAIAKAAVQQGQSPTVYHHLHRCIRHNLAPSEPVNVFGHAQHAVGIMTHQVRGDEMLCHIACFILGTS